MRTLDLTMSLSGPGANSRYFTIIYYYFLPMCMAYTWRTKDTGGCSIIVISSMVIPRLYHFICIFVVTVNYT